MKQVSFSNRMRGALPCILTPLCEILVSGSDVGGGVTMGLKDLNLNSVKADSRLSKDLPEATPDFCTMNECYNLLISLALLCRFGYVGKSAHRSAFKLLLI